jgi:hypothetical protein
VQKTNSVAPDEIGLDTDMELDQSPATYRPGFMRLPAEIRNQIFEYVVVQPLPLEARRPEPAITRVNKQIRDESLPIFYKQNTFQCLVSNYDCRELVRHHQRHDQFGPARIYMIHSLTADRKILRTNLENWLVETVHGRAPWINFGPKKDLNDMYQWEILENRVATVFDMARVMKREHAHIEWTKDIVGLGLDVAGVCCEDEEMD